MVSTGSPYGTSQVLRAAAVGTVKQAEMIPDKSVKRLCSLLKTTDTAIIVSFLISYETPPLFVTIYYGQMYCKILRDFPEGCSSIFIKIQIKKPTLLPNDWKKKSVFLLFSL